MDDESDEKEFKSHNKRSKIYKNFYEIDENDSELKCYTNPRALKKAHLLDFL